MVRIMGNHSALMSNPPDASPFPKIELHVHLEATVHPNVLFEMAQRNGFALPARDEEELARLYQYRDFEHFLDLWMMTTPAIQTEADFRRVVVSYAEEAARQGAVYLEGIFTPAERVGGGASWDQVYSGFCDGAVDAKERFGVDIRLTPDIPRILGLDAAIMTAEYAVKYKDRGIVGLGLGGPEASFPPEPFERAFLLAKEGGIGSVPHAGEAAGPASIRGAIDVLRADRIRHGIRAVEDPALIEELVERSIVCDVCPVSNLRTGVVESLETHPLPQMVAAGVLCSISTDDPVMFNTDLIRDYEAAAQLGCSPAQAFEAGLTGVLCDEETRSRLQVIYEEFPWGDLAGSVGSD
jgi:aminodeoxyfutalosine deaminase